jgi:peptide deformylase
MEAAVILKIVQVGDPVLRAAARALTRQEILSAETQQLIRDMRETMYEAPGVGLAAPQIGQSLQLAVIEDSEDNLEEVPPNDLIEKQRSPVPFHVIVNPVVTYLAEEKVCFYEGCLSLAGFSAVVPRARSIRVEYLDERGKARAIEASGWYARILQHEIDHLHGALYIDRMQSRTFTSLENWRQFAKGQSIPADSSGASRK